MDLENSELSCVDFQSRSIRSVEYVCRALVIKADVSFRIKLVLYLSTVKSSWHLGDIPTWFITVALMELNIKYLKYPLNPSTVLLFAFKLAQSEILQQR